MVGAGPGGLEAARVSAERGHDVVVFEAADKPGGQIRIAAGLARRREIMGIVDWRMAQCEKHGVEFRFNTYAEAEDVLAEDPDIVVVATGGMPNTSFLEQARNSSPGLGHPDRRRAAGRKRHRLRRQWRASGHDGRRVRRREPAPGSTS